MKTLIRLSFIAWNIESIFASDFNVEFLLTKKMIFSMRLLKVCIYKISKEVQEEIDFIRVRASIAL